MGEVFSLGLMPEHVQVARKLYYHVLGKKCGTARSHWSISLHIASYLFIGLEPQPTIVG